MAHGHHENQKHTRDWQVLIMWHHNYGRQDARRIFDVSISFPSQRKVFFSWYAPAIFLCLLHQDKLG